MGGGRMGGWGGTGVPYPLRPMIAVTSEELPVSAKVDIAYEPKWDGFRCLAFRGGERVALQSRQLRPLGRYFPEIVAAVRELDTTVVLDGELVLWRQGRMDFAALQQRIHPSDSRVRDLALAGPASYVVFDIVALDGRDVRAERYVVRRRLLEGLLGRQLPHGLVLMPMSTDPAVARAWMLNNGDAGIEGVVAKRLDHPYRENGRLWRKIRTRRTVDAVIGGILGPLARPEALILGRHDQRGRFRVVGRTSPLPPPARVELAGLLTPAEAQAHPWPVTIPSSSFGQRPAQPVVYQQVLPATVVELDADTAMDRHRYRHPLRFVRTRPELRPGDVERLR